MEILSEIQLLVKNNKFKCDICGKFIGYDEFDKNDIKIEFTPDTYYSVETIKFVHKKCEIN